MRRESINNIKIKLRAPSNRRFFALFPLLCFLCGCADVSSLNWLTGEPTAEVFDTPRFVSVPERNENESWPNLADIPTQKPIFSDLETRLEETEILVSDKYKARAESARIRQIDLPEPCKKVDKEDEDYSVEKGVIQKPFSALMP